LLASQCDQAKEKNNARGWVGFHRNGSLRCVLFPLKANPAAGILAEFFVLFALTAAIADLVMASPVDSVEEWLAALRLISSTEPTAKGIFPEFYRAG